MSRMTMHDIVFKLQLCRLKGAYGIFQTLLPLPHHSPFYITFRVRLDVAIFQIEMAAKRR
jgi:hypothetical protein